MPRKGPKPTSGFVDVRNRSIRGGAQLSTAALILQGLEEFHIATFTASQTKWLLVPMSVAVSALQNLAENRGWIGAFLKNVPEEPRAADK